MPTLRLLAIADRAPSRRVRDIINETPVDAIVTLGDLELSQIRDLELITDIPKLGVYGNHCSGSYMDTVGLVNMHLNTATIKGITFGGFEGSVRYKDSAYAKMYSQEEASALLKNFPRVDVMLTHCPPYGINDDVSDLSHTGFAGLRAYLDEHRPAYLLHGHTYPTEANIVRQYESTKIEYVFGERILEISVP
jgi:uncharacterized protein